MLCTNKVTTSLPEFIRCIIRSAGAGNLPVRMWRMTEKEGRKYDINTKRMVQKQKKEKEKQHKRQKEKGEKN